MINLITGAAGSGKSAKICEMIKNEIEHGSREVVLIVPEQQTVVWETRMSSALPVSANLRLEITNFTRLSNSVFREYGGLSDTVVDEGIRALTVWRAMLSVRDSLTTFKPTDAIMMAYIVLPPKLRPRKYRAAMSRSAFTGK